MRRKYKIKLIVCIVLFALCFAFNAYFAYSYYAMSAVEFQNLDYERLSARYHKSENGMGVIVVSDLGKDMGQAANLARELISAGYGVFLFDFPSQGLSEGNIQFQYRKTDYLAEQFYCAIVSYSQLANMSEDNITVVGYGEGARAVLQTAALGHISPHNMILVGTNINLTNKINYDILSFANDEQLEWISSINEYNPGCRIALISSNIDRASTVDDNEMLMNLLNKTTIASSLKKNSVELEEVKFVPNSVLMKSQRVSQAVLEQILTYDKKGVPANLSGYAKLPAELLLYLLFGLILFYSGKLIPMPQYSQPLPAKKRAEGILRSKILVHIPSIIVAGVLAFVLYVMPIHYPYHDILRFVIMASYGICILLLYRFTTFASNFGGLFVEKDGNCRSRVIVFSFAGLIGALILISAAVPTSIISFAGKWDWLLIFAALLTPIFYIDEKERRLFADDAKMCRNLFIVNYLMLIILPILMAPAGLFEPAFEILGMVIWLFVVTAFQYILRPLGISSFASAVIKSIAFVMLAFSHVPYFF